MMLRSKPQQLPQLQPQAVVPKEISRIFWKGAVEECTSRDPIRSSSRGASRDVLVSLDQTHEQSVVPGNRIEGSAPVWLFPQSTHVYENSSTDIDMGEEERDPNFCLPGRPPDNRRVEGEMHGEYGNSVFQAYRARIQDQVGEFVYNTISIYNPPWNDNQFTGHFPQSPFYQVLGSPPRGREIIEHRENDIKMSIELYRESSGDVSCSSSGTSNDQEVIRNEEPIAIESEVLDVDSNTYRSSDTEPAFLEAPDEFME
ncbi:hypothetical protein AYI68_g8210 [Smittium mucronatum]|uniref:Uncharacterized protein n=1 Tax=Smittium mucronatum TaxID=133383 RepID=A0A1R0GLJ2_9FUNG|nr:hypothetical protein AYI68_g8210 [Smittium mucronatum]